jgi:uncharacterized protein YndB with AHSA1/START domain
VTINRPVEDVFAVLSNVENTAAWYPAEVTEYWTSDGPVGVGSTRRAEGKAYGAKTVNDAEVTVYQPYDALGLRSISAPVPFEMSFRFTPVTKGTEVTWVTELRPAGMYRLIVPLTFGLHSRLGRRGMENLKRLMETGQL